MANNRLYLYCPPCKKSVYLTNISQSGCSTSVEIAAVTTEFLEEHLFCEESRGEARQVELRFEHHDDKAREVPTES